MTDEIELPPIGLSLARDQLPQCGPKNSYLRKLKAHGVSYKEEMVFPSQLKSSQGEFDKDSIRSIRYSPEKVKSAIIISKDNYVLDGHHRWATNYNYKKGTKMKVIRVDLPILELIHLTKTFKSTTYRSIDAVRGIRTTMKRLLNKEKHK